MANMSEGTYRIHSSADTSLVLDVAGLSRGNGANVRLLTLNQASDGQVFEVSQRWDGTWRITPRFSGKALDVGDTPANNQSVKQWSDLGTRDQSWDIADSSSTTTIGGTSYPLFNVTVDLAVVQATAEGEGAAALSDAKTGREPVGITLYGAWDDEPVSGSMYIGSEEVELPTWLCSLPSGICDKAVIEDGIMTVYRNCGMITEYDEDEDLYTVGDDYRGTLTEGGTVYYALDQGEDSEDGYAAIEEYVLELPEIASSSASVSCNEGADAYIVVTYWADELPSDALYMCGVSAASKSDVKIYKSSSIPSTALSRWAFVPVPEFESGGVYELHSYANPSLVMTGASTTSLSNILLQADKDSNLQRWIMDEQSSGKWTIRNVESHYYAGIGNAAPYEGKNVRQEPDTASYMDNSVRWYPESYGTTSYDGASRPVVKLVNWIAGDPTNASVDHYVMDVDGSAVNNANIRLTKDTGASDQLWILVRTTTLDPRMPVPTDLCVAKASGDSYAAGTGASWGVYKGKVTRYPYWQCADSWVSSGSANHYQYRQRIRYMDSDTSAWSDWSSWTSWKAYPTKVVDYYLDESKRGTSGWAGEQAWKSDGVTVNLTLQDTEDTSGTVTQGTKAAEVQWSVRSVGAGSTSNLVSKAASHTQRFCWGPTMKMHDAYWTPTGYNIRINTDYNKGAWTVKVTSLKVNGKELLESPYQQRLSGLWGTLNIPLDGTSGVIPAIGSTVEMTWRCTTDLFTAGTIYAGSVPLQWERHSTWHPEPVVTERGGFRKRATVTHAEGVKVRMWCRRMQNGSIKFTELTGTASPTKTVFDFNPPQDDFELWTTAVLNNDDWGTDYLQVAYSSPDGLGKRHIWTYGSSYAQLLLREGEPLTLDGTLSSNEDAVELNKRAYQTVRFQNTRNYKLTVEGAIVPGHLSGGDLKNLLALVGKHCVYRSPFGNAYTVAVTDVRHETKRQWTEVSVSMIVETV